MPLLLFPSPPSSTFRVLISKQNIALKRWPAMVEDDAEYKRLDENEKLEYHVVFFDDRALRGWIKVKNLILHGSPPKDDSLKKKKIPTCLVGHDYSITSSYSMTSKSETDKILKRKKTKENAPSFLESHDYSMTPSDSMSSKSETRENMKKNKTKARQMKEHITSHKKVQLKVTNISIPPVNNNNIMWSDRSNIIQSEISPQPFPLSPVSLYPQVTVPGPTIEEINHFRSIGFGEFCSDPEEWRSNKFFR